MAREYAKNWFSMWTDDDFCRQPVFDKLLFNILLGQPVTVLNYAGIQTLNFKRLRRAMRNGEHLPTELDIKAALIRMEDRRYVFTDDDTGECLIRSFIRRDEVYKQPNVMLSALRAASVVESPKLAHVLHEELTSRIVLPQICGDSAKANSLRDNLKLTKIAAIDHLLSLTETISEPFQKPFAEDFPEGFPEGLPEPFTRPAEIEPLPKPFAEGFATGSVVVGVEVSPSPPVATHLGERPTENPNADQGRTTDPNEPPPETCPKHRDHADPPPCGACAGYRRRRDAWLGEHETRTAAQRAEFWAHVRQCPHCDDHGMVDADNGVQRCTEHDWRVIA